MRAPVDLLAQWRHDTWSATFWATGAITAILGLILPIATYVSTPGPMESGPLILLIGRDDTLGEQYGNRALGQYQALVQQWNDLHEDSRVQIVELPPLADLQRAEMVSRARAPAGGVDVFGLDVVWTSEFAENGYIQQIDETSVAREAFLPAPLSTGYVNGRLWALPFTTGTGLLYYRRDLLASTTAPREVLAPRTWEEVEESIDAYRRLGGQTRGYVGQFADYEGLTVNALELIRGHGGEVVDQSGRVVIDDHLEEVRSALQRLRRIAPDIRPTTEADATQDFLTGQAMFMRNWPLAYRSLSQPAEPGQSRPDFRAVSLPAGSSALGGQNLAIAANTARPVAARALVDFLTSDRSQQILFERGGLPATRKVVYRDNRLRTILGSDYVDSVEEALVRAGEAKTPSRPMGRCYSRFSRVMRSIVLEYLRKPQTDLPSNFGDQLQNALDCKVEPR